MSRIRRGVGAVTCILLLGSCGELAGGFTVSPDRIEAASWAAVELTLDGLPPRATLDVGSGGLHARGDVRVTVGPQDATLLGVNGAVVRVGLTAMPPVGNHSVVVTNADGRWESINRVEVVGVPGDGGIGDGSAGDGGGPGGTLTEVPGLEVPGRCTADPALTQDGRWLLIARGATDDCSSPRRIYIYSWNDGVPVDTSRTVDIADVGGTANAAAPFDGAAVGFPGEYGVVYNVSTVFGARLVQQRLSGDPPAPTGSSTDLRAGISPSLTQDGTLMVFSDLGILYELGSPFVPGAAARPMTELIGDAPSDPAISADGLMLAYVAAAGPAGDRDIYFTRRASIDDLFGVATPLPKGTGQVNTDADEWDPSFTVDGGLLFTSARELGVRRVYWSRAPTVSSSP